MLGGTGPQGRVWLTAGLSVVIGSPDAGRAEQAAASLRVRSGTQGVRGADNAGCAAESDLVVRTSRRDTRRVVLSCPVCRVPVPGVSASQAHRIAEEPDLLTCLLMVSELPDDAQRWNAAERELALQVLHGRTVVVNVRRGGPHRHLVPWLLDQGMISYVGHAGSRHSWPQSDFANPFVKQAGTDRKAIVRRYREWLDEQPELLARIRDGELTGRALGCWCAPQLCHADVLAEHAQR